MLIQINSISVYSECISKLIGSSFKSFLDPYLQTFWQISIIQKPKTNYLSTILFHHCSVFDTWIVK